uniref:G_PROTEIN_RECEP_F1_2 domain-containing protein n=1 Tax=Meloidogyne hapla TaxID=6305 RepID=A0A1I8BQL4_MELHA
MIAVVLPNKSHLIDDRAVKIIVMSIYPIAIVLSLFADYILPCCRTNYSFKTYSYQFFIWNESTTNYKNMLMDLPMNIITTTIIFICYGAIFAKVIRTNRKDVIQMSTNTELKKNRRKGEIKCAVHFALISTFYIGKYFNFNM